MKAIGAVALGTAASVLACWGLALLQGTPMPPLDSDAKDDYLFASILLTQTTWGLFALLAVIYAASFMVIYRRKR